MPRATPQGPLHHAALLLLLAACTPQPAAPRDAAPVPREAAASPQVAPSAPSAPGLDTVEVRGRVRAWDGAAIAGAIITAREDAALAGAAPGEADPALARTDAAGQFTLRLPPGGLVELHAAAPGHADGLDEGPAPGHAFDLWLAPEATLAGVVTRAGAPVPGARVLAERAGGLTPLTAEVMTDAAGQFRLERLEPGSYSLRALTDDAAGAAASPVILGLAEARAGLTIAVTPALRITGQIVTADATPCAAGGLELTDESRGQRLRFPTGPDGRIQALGLMPGEYQVVATCEGSLPGESARLVMTDTPVLDQLWRVTPGLAIRGRVLAADGGPATRLRVHATAEPDPDHPRPSYAEVAVDAGGRFVLSGLAPGPYRVTLTAHHTEARAVPQEPLRVILPDDSAELTLRLPVTGELRGTLRDAGGHGIDRAMIMLAGSADALHVLAADDGGFVFPSVAPREYQLIARRNGQRLAGAAPQGEAVTVVADRLTTIAPIVATPDLRLTGLVRDPSGAPLAGAFVVLRGRSLQFLAPPVQTDAAGRFTIPALAPGRYRVRAYRRGGGEASAEQVEAGSDLTLTLAAP